MRRQHLALIASWPERHRVEHPVEDVSDVERVYGWLRDLVPVEAQWYVEVA